MKLRLNDKKIALKLRSQGKTYGEILSVIPNLPKSTLSGWLKNIELTPQQESKLKKHLKLVLYRGQAKSALVKRKEREKRIKNIRKEAREEYIKLSKTPFFLVGLVFYWAEGSKKSKFFQFTNSDPIAIKTMLRWLRKTCKIPEKEIRLGIQIHKIYADENCEKFWAKISGIPSRNFLKTTYKPTPHKIKRNPDYKGCVHLRIYRTAFFLKVMEWLQNLIKEYKLN